MSSALQKSKATKSEATSTAFLVVIAGGIDSTVSHTFNSGEPIEKRPLCLTRQCKDLAKSLVESMNQSMDPCEDFYEYACGNWAKYNPLPVNETRWNMLTKSQKEVEERLEEIMEERSKPDDLHKMATKFAKMAFAVCLDTDEIERAGLQPLVSTMWRSGGWPLIMEEDEWDEKTYKWQNVDDYYARLTGLNSFHDVHVSTNYWIHKGLHLFIDTPHLSPNVYKLINLRNVDVTCKNDEDNNSEEVSQERGSEDDHEDELKIQKRDIDNRKINSRRIHKRSNTIEKTTKKHANEKKLKIRTKRAVTQARIHNKKYHVQRRIVNRVIKKNAEKLSRHKLVRKSDSIEESKEYPGNWNNRKIMDDTNNDLYFEDENADQGKNNSDDNRNDENDRENDSNYNEHGSGGGDYYEWNDEDGSGDYEWDNERGRGIGDDSDDDDDDDKSDEIWKTDEEEVRKTRKTYSEYILNVSVALSEARGIPIPRERLVKDIADLVKFQIEFVKYIFEYDDGSRAKLKTLQTRYDALDPRTENGKINWITKVKDVFAVLGGMEITDDYVVISSYGYVEALSKLLDRTPSRIIVNYIHWNFLSKVIKASTKRMREFYRNWNSLETLESKRTKQCIADINANYILGYEYVKRYLSEEVLQAASDVADEIQKEVEYQVESSTWMDDEVRDIILDKLVYVKKKIGYPSSYRNITVTNEHFRGLSASRSHFENVLSIMRHEKSVNLRSTFAENDSIEAFDELDFDPLIVNAFLSLVEHSTRITTADLQQPFFDFKQPWYTNYGIIGVIMSHEVNHGFDILGRLFNKDGGFAKWSRKMLKAYDRRAECLIDQFTRYSIVEKKTGNISIENYGMRTSVENIADTMALNSVFKAYKRRLRKYEKADVALPGFEHMSNEQLFFLSFANTRCEVLTPEKMETKFRQDSHSLGLSRVIDSVSNSKDFAEAYNCPLNSPMNPKKKCNIWE